MEASEVLKYHGVPFWKLPAIARTTRRLMAREIGSVSLVPGLETALQLIHQAGYTMAVLTSNSKQSVKDVLGERLSRLFSHFECEASILTKRKLLKKVLRDLDASRE